MRHVSYSAFREHLARYMDEVCDNRAALHVTRQNARTVVLKGAGHMLKAYIAVALGGWGSVPGALLGALGIGIFETFVSAGFGDAWASAALYIAVLAALALRPQGLFGEPVGRRA